MKGIILAGGTGTRLRPLTTLINKHLLSIYDKPMIYYPLMTLINSGIEEIMIVSGREHAGQFLQMLGSGKEFGVNLSYTVQEKAGGIAQALGLCRRFTYNNDYNDNIAVILGDNIFEEKFDFDDFNENLIDDTGFGARVYLKEVPDANRFGVAEIKDDKIIGIEEKPKEPKSNYAVTGLYLYDSNVFDVISRLKPSGRGELEITDVNSWYIRQGLMDYRIVKGFWSDAGTFSSLFNASEFMKNKVER